MNRKAEKAVFMAGIENQRGKIDKNYIMPRNVDKAGTLIAVYRRLHHPRRAALTAPRLDTWTTCIALTLRNRIKPRIILPTPRHFTPVSPDSKSKEIRMSFYFLRDPRKSPYLQHFHALYPGHVFTARASCVGASL